MSEKTFYTPAETLQAKKPVSIEQAHKALFGTDYEYVRNSGMLDIFHEGDSLDDDALLHILAGNVSGGFHSTAAVDLLNSNPETAGVALNTYVDRDHLQNKNGKTRRKYRERPYEPFGARSVIDGLYKMQYQKGKPEPVGNAITNMFPSEYDPLSIVVAINAAYTSMNRSEDQIKLRHDGSTTVVNDTGVALMLDGETKLPITIVMDPQGRVLTAMPAYKTSGFMNLEKEQVREHLGIT